MNNTEKLPSYGGQAIIEGVMMRGQNSVAAAMRSPDGEIVIHDESLSGIYRSNIRKIPFLRGLIILWDALGLGTRFLTMSANLQTGEDEKIEGASLILTLAGSLIVAVGLFFLLPAAAAEALQRWLNLSAWVGNIIEGVVRLLFLILYVWAIGKMPDIERVYGYHGAEHKTINAFEAGAELTPENVKNYSVEHARCGTAFLLTVVVFSIIIFSALGPLSLAWRLASRVLLIPVVAGLAYEYIRWSGNHLDSPIIRALVRPNLALQHLTTREPSLEMLEVSIAAFKAMIVKEEAQKITV
jgi:uncharacterized protein YqhQ